jgi:hypothetical protein
MTIHEFTALDERDENKSLLRQQWGWRHLALLDETAQPI